METPVLPSLNDPVVYHIFLIFFGAAVFATIALYARQVLLVSYIVLGMLLGPAGVGWVTDTHLIKQVADIGIIFLLFLLGLNLPPQKLRQLVRETTLVTAVTSFAFMASGTLIGLAFGFDWIESLVIGAATGFSSTIIGLKLLPTTVLHHQRTGEIITSILLLQDMLAMAVLLLLQGQGMSDKGHWQALLTLFWLPGLFLFAFAVERFLLIRLIRRFDRYHEYIFLLAIGWCLGMAELAGSLHLSSEIGAFIAGVALARHRIANYIAESLKPLRDFFLIVFFFSIGSNFTPGSIGAILWPALALAAGTLLFKPVIYAVLLRSWEETAGRATEIGLRLGQLSEFSLLVAMLALQMQVIGQQAAEMIIFATVITLVISPYFVIFRYPSPMAVSERLRRD
jgi:Kef-type K+ transport system membrane component KefB